MLSLYTPAVEVEENIFLDLIHVDFMATLAPPMGPMQGPTNYIIVLEVFIIIMHSVFLLLLWKYREDFFKINTFSLYGCG